MQCQQKQKQILMKLFLQYAQLPMSQNLEIKCPWMFSIFKVPNFMSQLIFKLLQSNLLMIFLVIPEEYFQD